MENDSSNSANAQQWPELRPLSLRLVILSRSRSRTMTSHRLFPKATLLVPESELEQYAHIPLEKATVPDAIMGISSLRNKSTFSVNQGFQRVSTCCLTNCMTSWLVTALTSRAHQI